MITATEKQNQQALSLPSLAGEINAKHDATTSSARTTLTLAREAGRLLIIAKSKVAHGEWAAWLSENCPELSQRTANEYKQVANNWDAIIKLAGDSANLSISSALNSIAKPSQRTVPVTTPEPTAEPVATAAPVPATPVETAGVLSAMADSPTTTETEVPEIVQRVQSVLRSHFNEDELPTEESHCKAIAVVDEEAWPDVAEAARERGLMRGDDPKLQDYRDAARDENWQHKRKLTEKYGVLAMQTLDELHELKPNLMRHGTGMKQIQAFLNELKGWR